MDETLKDQLQVKLQETVKGYFELRADYSLLDDSFSAEDLRAIADAMDKLKPVKNSSLADFDIELIESNNINGIEFGTLKFTPKQ